MTAGQSIAVLAMAVALDLALGDPPNTVHPVAWMGRCIALFGRFAPTRGRALPLMAGMAFMLAGLAMVAGLAIGLLRLTAELPLPIAVCIQAVVLKTTFSIRSLVRAGRCVQQALISGDLPAARQVLGWHLVSRNTASLSDHQVAAAAIESLAENASDSIVAPMVFYACAGLPGAMCYRFINTCDAMLGYRDARREWLGKFPARLDDVANFLPARMTAVLLIVAGTFIGRNPLRAMRIWKCDRHRTASPNAGHPMSAAAGVLDLELEKVGHYCLGRGRSLPTPTDIAQACRLVYASAALACLVAGILLAALPVLSAHEAPDTIVASQSAAAPTSEVGHHK